MTEVLGAALTEAVDTWAKQEQVSRDEAVRMLLSIAIMHELVAMERNQ